MSTLEGIQQRGTDILEVYSDDSTRTVGRVGPYTLTLYGVEIDNDPPAENTVVWWLEDALHHIARGDRDQAATNLKAAAYLLRYVHTKATHAIVKALAKAIQVEPSDFFDNELAAAYNLFKVTLDRRENFAGNAPVPAISIRRHKLLSILDNQGSPWQSARPHKLTSEARPIHNDWVGAVMLRDDRSHPAVLDFSSLDEITPGLARLWWHFKRTHGDDVEAIAPRVKNAHYLTTPPETFADANWKAYLAVQEKVAALSDELAEAKERIKELEGLALLGHDVKSLANEAYTYLALGNLEMSCEYLNHLVDNMPHMTYRDEYHHLEKVLTRFYFKCGKHGVWEEPQTTTERRLILAWNESQAALWKINRLSLNVRNAQTTDTATGRGEGMTRDDLPYRAGP